MSETTKEAQHKNIAYKNSLEEIGCLIKSSIPLIYILTHEERRFVKALETEIINPTKRQIYAWSSYKGLVKWQEWDNVARAKGEMDGTWAAPKCLETIAQIPIPSDKRGIVFCLLDFNQMLAQSIPRQLKDMLENLDRKTIIIVSGQLAYGPGLQKNGLEPTLEKEIHVVEYELPSRLEHEQYLDGTIGSMKAALEDPNVKRKANNTKRKIDYSKEEIWEFSRALQGLTSQEANAAVMSSLVHLDEINFDKLLLEKKQIIKKSDILEYIDVKPSIDDVGGLDLAKEYCKYYSDQFNPEAREFGLEPLKGVLLLGCAGCIGKDVLIPYNRGKRVGVRYLSIEKLYKKFNGISKEWDLSIPTYTYSYDNKNNKMVMNRIVKLIQSGIKPVVKITTMNNKTITLTNDHPVLIASGEYVEAKDLKKGQRVLIVGSMIPVKGKGKDLQKRKYNGQKYIETLKYHPYGNPHKVNGYLYKRVYRAHLVVEATMNNMTLADFIETLKWDKEKSKQLVFLDPSCDVYHKDENPANDKMENLIVLSHNEHARLHGKEENFHKEYVIEDIIQDISPFGETMTYDIQMEEPYRNFTANRFIVHNCGKSLLAKTTASVWRLPLLRLDVGKVLGGIVGSSEARMRDALLQAKAISPCILWCDEIEKAIGGVKSSAQSDSGTLLRVFGTLLTAMEEGLEGVIIIATANDISQLPPELIRRFNEVFFVDLPQPEEREEIFGIHLRKRKRDLKKINMKTLVAASHLYTGSEIEKAVKEGLARSWRDGKRELRTEDILGALKDTKPLSTVMAEKISEMRTWARNRARYASSYAQEAQASGAQVVTSSSGNKLKVGEVLDDIEEIETTTEKKKNKKNKIANIMDEE